MGSRILFHFAYPPKTATDAEILETSIVARSTVERDRNPLTRVDAVVLLVRGLCRLIHGCYPIQSAQDYLVRLYTEDDFIRLRVDISKEIMGDVCLGKNIA
jgi:hypothetical protein